MNMKMQIKPYRKEKIENRLIGYHPHFRGRFTLLRDKKLTNSEFVLWDFCYSVLADWDKRHKGTYGCFDYTHEEIATFLGCDNTTISKNMKSLIKKSYIKENAKGLYEITYYVEFAQLIDQVRKKNTEPCVISHQVISIIENIRSSAYEFSQVKPKQGVPDLFGNTADIEDFLST